MQIPSKQVHVRNMGYGALIYLIEQINGVSFFDALANATKRIIYTNAQFSKFVKSNNLIERMFTETDCTIQQMGSGCTDYDVHFWDSQNQRNRFKMYNGCDYVQAVAVAFIIGKTGKEIHDLPENLF